MTNNNDAPAFPQRVSTGVCSISDNGKMEREFQTVGGLTKREWFAGMAMQGILSDNKNIHALADAYGSKRNVNKVLAEASLHYADALLSELNNKEEK